MNIKIITKVEVFVLIECSYRGPLPIEPRIVIIFLAQSRISSKHASFCCMFITSKVHVVGYCSCIGLKPL
jgi:hypothetical protein